MAAFKYFGEYFIPWQVHMLKVREALKTASYVVETIYFMVIYNHPLLGNIRAANQKF